MLATSSTGRGGRTCAMEVLSPLDGKPDDDGTCLSPSDHCPQAFHMSEYHRPRDFHQCERTSTSSFHCRRRSIVLGLSAVVGEVPSSRFSSLVRRVFHALPIRCVYPYMATSNSTIQSKSSSPSATPPASQADPARRSPILYPIFLRAM